MNKGINMYVIKTGNQFIKATSYGFISTTSSLQKASLFKTLKEAQAQSKQVIEDFSASDKHNIESMNEMTKLLTKNETALAKAKTKLDGLKSQPHEKVESQVNTTKRSIQRLEDEIRELKYAMKVVHNDMKNSMSMNKPVVYKLTLEVA